MAKYRCPRCGSPHKEPAEQCRQCGANMLDPTPSITAGIDQSAAAARYAPRSVVPFILGGIAIVILLGVGAVALGVVRGGDQVTNLTQELTAAEKADGWIIFEEPNDVFAVKMPGEPQVEDGRTMPGPDGTPIDIAWYGRGVTDYVQVAVQYTEGADIPQEDPYDSLNAVAENLAVGPTEELARPPVETSYQGRPAVDFVLDDITIKNIPVTVRSRLILLENGELLLIAATAPEDGSQQYQRMITSLELYPNEDQT